MDLTSELRKRDIIFQSKTWKEKATCPSVVEIDELAEKENIKPVKELRNQCLSDTSSPSLICSENSIRSPKPDIVPEEKQCCSVYLQ